MAIMVYEDNQLLMNRSISLKATESWQIDLEESNGAATTQQSAWAEGQRIKRQKGT